LSLSLPISVVEINGAKAYSGGFGVGLSGADERQLDPGAVAAGVRRGVHGPGAPSPAVTTGSVTSVYQWEFDSLRLAMGNMVSYNSTMKVRAGDLRHQPGLQDHRPAQRPAAVAAGLLGGSRLALEYSAIDTRYVGSQKPFITNFQEYGVTIGTNRDAMSARSFLRAWHQRYTQGKGMKGATLDIGYWF
jgi:hypothetical protein